MSIKFEACNREAVLLLAHGTPDVLGEMAEYLTLVTGGRQVPLQVVEDLQERYAAIGLTEDPGQQQPHLTRWTQRQAEALRQRIDLPVYVAMRNWKPFIPDVLQQMKDDGITQIRVVCLAPQNSRTSVGLFRRAVEAAAGTQVELDFVTAWADHTMLVQAFADRANAALTSVRLGGSKKIAVLFTAHSVPTRTVQPTQEPVEYHGILSSHGPDSYADDCRATAELVSAELRRKRKGIDCFFAFQSQGLSGGPWIGPTVEETLEALRDAGYDTAMIQPIGFLCDHVEVLYDIDVVFQQKAEELGIRLVRAESLNDSSLLIDALEDLALYGSDYVKRRDLSQMPLHALHDESRAHELSR